MKEREKERKIERKTSPGPSPANAAGHKSSAKSADCSQLKMKILWGRHRVLATKCGKETGRERVPLCQVASQAKSAGNELEKLPHNLTVLPPKNISTNTKVRVYL